MEIQRQEDVTTNTSLTSVVTLNVSERCRICGYLIAAMGNGRYFLMVDN